jgi:hypothetical protein
MPENQESGADVAKQRPQGEEFTCSLIRHSSGEVTLLLKGKCGETRMNHYPNFVQPFMN